MKDSRGSQHILILGYSMHTMLTEHPQFCVLGSLLHTMVGILFVVVGVLRVLGLIFEASMVMVIVGAMFAAGSECSVTFADYMFEEVSFLLIVVMFWGTWWLYVANMFRTHWCPEMNEDQATGYSPVQASTELEEDGKV